MKSKAAVLYEVNLPRPYAASRPLRVEEIEIDPPRAGEVLVKVAAAGICHSDLSVVDGTRPRPTPMVLGHEGSGVVVEVGPHVTEVRPGDHVVFSFVPTCGRCAFCAEGRPALCEPGYEANVKGELLTGGIRFRNASAQLLHHHLGVSCFSEYTVVSQESLVKVDRSIPPERAAIFGCAVLTGAGAVFNTARVAPGKSVAVFGLGGVGLNVVLAARAVGAWPIVAVDLLDAKLQLAKELGATEVVNASRQDAVAAVRDLTRGGADYAFEAVGSDRVWQQVYAATRRGGTAIAIGLAAPTVDYRIPAVSLVGEEKRVMGCYMGSAVPTRDVPRFLQMYQAGLLPVDQLVTRHVMLDQVNEAFDALAAGEVVRQLVRF